MGIESLGRWMTAIILGAILLCLAVIMAAFTVGIMIGFSNCP